MRLLLIALLAGLTACQGGWDKDPFSGQEDNVQKAVPQGGNKEKNPPVQAVMHVDVDSTYLMKEGQKKILPIDYRLLHPEFEFLSVSIPNLESELPGATFDPDTRELVFEPEEGYVPSGGLMFSSIVRISLFAEYKGLKQEIRKEVTFNVVRGSAEDPEVLSIDDIEPELFEGQRDAFKIRIKDEVSPGGPILSILNPANGFYNGAQFITFSQNGRPVIGEPGVYEFTAYIDLRNSKEITATSERFRFEVQAFSFMGIPSNTLRADFKVFSTASKPKFVTENLEVNVGEKVSYNFVVFDTKNEGILQTKFTNDCSLLAGNAKCSCRDIRSQSTCTLEWTPTEAGAFDFELEATNTVNQFATAQQVGTQTDRFRVTVIDNTGGAPQ